MLDSELMRFCYSKLSYHCDSWSNNRTNTKMNNQNQYKLQSIGLRGILTMMFITTVTLLYVCTDQYNIFIKSLSSTTALQHNKTDLQIVETKIDNIENVYQADRKAHEFLIDTPGCRIPDLPTISTEKKAFFQSKVARPKCESGWYKLSGKNRNHGPPLVQSNLTSMWIIRSALKYYKIKDLRDIECCYRSFERQQENPQNYSQRADKLARFSKQCVPFHGDSITIKLQDDEFVRVECFRMYNISKTKDSKLLRKKEIYRDFHAFVPLKNHVEKRCRNNSQIHNKLSVLVIGIDSVSRLNMLRQLPKTYEILTSPPLSAISLLGYNKVGDNTLPNLIPLLTGYSLEELTSTCFPNWQTKLDSCPFIWKDFAANGFRTAYGEDFPSISTFNYKKTGFVEQPTDYYTRAFSLESWNQLGHNGQTKYKLCTGSRQSFEYTLQYIQKFVLRFSNDRYFGFFWSSIESHEDLNLPHFGDKLLADMVKELRDSGALLNTVLLVMSDHGIRFGKFRETYQGRMEERLPFLLTSFPKWFANKFPNMISNYKLNAQNRLVTPFDVHETLVDILSLNKNAELKVHPQNSTLNGVQRLHISNVTSSRGVSLFNPISPNRTCDDAAILPHWCTCQRTSLISTNHSAIQTAVKIVLQELNHELKAFSKCEVLQLKHIKYAEKKEEEFVTMNKRYVDYLVVFITSPGSAIFEATVRQIDKHNDNNLTEDHFQMTSPVSRLNKYGNQSYCVANSKIKMYCFCVI